MQAAPPGGQQAAQPPAAPIVYSILCYIIC